MKKTWFITGTSTGFGRELTERLLAHGDRVAATLRWPALLHGLAEQYGPNLWVRDLDVTKTARIREVVDAAFEQLGRVDMVVSNAAYRLLGAAEELTDRQIAGQIETNVVGSVQLPAPSCLTCGRKAGGELSEISGMCGQIGLPGLSAVHIDEVGARGVLRVFRGRGRSLRSAHVSRRAWRLPQPVRQSFECRCRSHGRVRRHAGWVSAGSHPYPGADRAPRRAV